MLLHVSLKSLVHSFEETGRGSYLGVELYYYITGNLTREGDSLSIGQTDTPLCR